MASQRRACDTAGAGRKVDEAARASIAEATCPILRSPGLSSLSPHSVLRHRLLCLVAPCFFLLSLSRSSWLRGNYPSFYGRRFVQSGSAMWKVERRAEEASEASFPDHDCIAHDCQVPSPDFGCHENPPRGSALFLASRTGSGWCERAKCDWLRTLDSMTSRHHHHAPCLIDAIAL